jgi:hypothetical protein
MDPVAGRADSITASNVSATTGALFSEDGTLHYLGRV